MFCPVLDTDQDIFDLRQIDRGLAAHRGIHHRQQRGGQLHAVDATHPAGRGKAGEVADHATAECIDAGIATRPQRRQCIDGAGEAVEGLGGLARRQHELADRDAGARPAQRVRHPRGIGRRDLAVANQQGLAATQRAGQQGAVIEQPGADMPRNV